MVDGGGEKPTARPPLAFRRVGRKLEGPLTSVDAWQYWTFRLSRWIVGHHHALVEVTLRTEHADAARRALEQRGWRSLATVGADDGEVTLAFTARIPTNFSIVAPAPTLHRTLSVALADARVHDVRQIVIDPSVPPYRATTEWRLQNRHPARVFTDAAAPTARLALRRYAVGPVDVEVVPPLGSRLSGAVAYAESVLGQDRVQAITALLGTILGALAFVVTQLVASADTTIPRSGLYLWQQTSLRRTLLIAGSILAVLTIGTRLVHGRWRHRLRGGAVVVGAVVAGVLLGGVVRDLFSIATVAGLAFVGVVALVWGLAGRSSLTWLATLVRVSTLVGSVVGFGQWRALRYYAGMGLSASDIDVPALDPVLFGLRPFAEAGLVTASILGFAWFASSRGLPLVPTGMAIVAVASGVGLLLTTSQADEVSGREVAVGRATLAAPGLRLRPGPTMMCLTSLAAQPDPQHPTLVGSLPRLVWKIGTLGQQTLVLDPLSAQKAFPQYAAAYVGGSRRSAIDRNLAAPVLYVPTNQVTFRRAGGDRCSVEGLRPVETGS